MYNNIGKKIKGLAKLLAYGGIFLSCLVGISLTLGIIADDSMNGNAFIIGPIIVVVGSFVFWLSGFFMYGFGELVDQTTEINKKLEYKKAESIE